MSGLLDNPRVRVHVGDGFKFLQENTSTYDAIITDSSDPVGPAEALFQKPYFQLLHDALTPGGHISTQAECLWLHLPLIKELHEMTKALFAVSEYAFTTISTYPAGQIGFVVCSKEQGRDLKTPVRKVAGTRYYSENVHKAAFVLPEFGRAMIEEGQNILPKFGRALAEAKLQQPKKKILLLGSGFVARPCAEYIVRNAGNELTVACRTLKSAQALAEGLPATTAISLDVNSTSALDEQVAAHDLVISLIPYTYHAAVIQSAIKGKTHVVTTSYVSPAMRELDEAAKKAGIVVMNEIGLDPGIDHLYAVKTISEIHAKGGKVKQFLSYCCGLPAPECSGNPLGYKFSWSSRGVLLALLNNASYIASGKQVDIDGKDLMQSAQPYFISPAFAFVAYPNRNSVPFREWYNIPEAELVIRGTLRYQGFPEFVKVLVQLGWLDMNEKAWLTSELTWLDVMQKLTDVEEASESAVIAHLKATVEFPSESEATRIISGFRWIGLFSTEKINVRGGNLLDTLCARLEDLMKYDEGERDLVMLQHKFVVEWQDGSEQTLTSTLEEYGIPYGHSAMARTVGVPCGIATQLVLDGVLNQTGIQAPYTKEICDPIRALLEAEGLSMVERVL
ncbi:saccharopine dehydrogenase [Heliocybe sulcata]|uniref:Saccharopine dehydrogenase n=1 Tax=Heliocybe sulcata TaxID=5364 RepID=A0A5C3MVP6_9AGAM|nr:saccharopine dehydrogenase [Heliocybe sulcata]